MLDRDSLTPRFVGATSASAFGCGRKAALVHLRLSRMANSLSQELDSHAVTPAPQVH